MFANSHQQDEDEHVPAEFVEKRRHVPVPYVANGNFHSEGEELQAFFCDTQAVGFHIDIIAPTADALTEHKRGRDNVQQCQHGNLVLSADQLCRNQPADDAAVDGQTAFANVENGKQIITVIVETESHIIQPRTDNAERNGIEHEIDDRILRQAQAARFI